MKFIDDDRMRDLAKRIRAAATIEESAAVNVEGARAMHAIAFIIDAWLNEMAPVTIELA